FVYRSQDHLSSQIRKVCPDSVEPDRQQCDTLTDIGVQFSPDSGAFPLFRINQLAAYAGGSLLRHPADSEYEASDGQRGNQEGRDSDDIERIINPKRIIRRSKIR